MYSVQRNAEIEDECTLEIHVIRVICVRSTLTGMTLIAGTENFTAHSNLSLERSLLT